MRPAGGLGTRQAPSDPLVGREAELVRLVEALRAGRPIGVVGEAGIGKSSLARAAVAASGRALHEGGGFATLAWLPYLALRRAVDLAEGDGPAQVADTVRRAVGGGVLFIDDLQWADAATHRVLELVMADVAVMVAVRDGDSESARVVRQFQSTGGALLRLARLDRGSSRALAGRLMPAADPEALDWIVDHGAGNPMLIEELALHGEPPTWLVRAIAASGPAAAAAGGGAKHRPVRSEAVRDALLAGRFAAAAAAAGAALELPAADEARERLLAWRGLALALLGRAEEADAAFARAATVRGIQSAGGTSGGPDAGTLTCWAEAALWSGLPNHALERASAALRIAEADADRAMAAVTRAWAEIELGREPAGDVGLRPGRVAGVEPELRGLAAFAAGKFAAAAGFLGEAASLWAGRHVPRELICRWAGAEARRRAGDLEAARASLREVLASASAAAFEPLAARIRRSLRLAGDRLPLQSLPRPAGSLLTGRERQVLELVARGRTNAEIARRMGLGRPTVARLLSNAMAKLGADSRTHAVVLAALA